MPFVFSILQVRPLHRVKEWLTANWDYLIVVWDSVAAGRTMTAGTRGRMHEQLQWM